MKHLYRVSVPIADLRAAPDTASELLTQAVLATPAEAQESRGLWTLVDLPDYRGWVRSAELAPADQADQGRSLLIAAPRIEGVLDGSSSRLRLYAGTVLAELARSPDTVVARLPDGRAIRLPASGTSATDGRAGAPRATRVGQLLAFARQFLGAPYLWGGWTVEGIDCSGLVQLAYRIVGQPLPRDAHQQYAAMMTDVAAPGPRPLAPDPGVQQRAALMIEVAREALRPGDLVFFREDDRISHVGIFVGDGGYLHASMLTGRVLISQLFQPADDIGRAYAAKYAGAKRAIPDE